MNNETILVIALLVSNAVWMLFHVLAHAQHLRATAWMIGFRPTPPAPQIIHSHPPATLLPQADLSGIFPPSPRGMMPEINGNGAGERKSPMSDMGTLEP